MTAPKTETTNVNIPEATTGVQAARRLMEACAGENSAQLEVVRDLARDLQRELEVYSTAEATPDALTAAAARCADLASLAACNVVHVPAAGVGRAAAATHLSAGAARALAVGVEAAQPTDRYALRDARGAGWRARLAAQQVDELLEARAAEA